MRKSEARFQNAFERAPIGMVLATPEGNFIRVNAALCKMLGYSRAELLEKNLRDISHQGDLANDLPNIQSMLDGTLDIYRTEKRYRHKSGTYIWAILSSSLTRDEEGRPRFFIAHIQDITERKTAEEERLAGQKQLRTLSELMTDYVFQLSLQENGDWTMSILAGNYHQATGFTERDISTPDDWQTVIHPDDLPQVRQIFAQVQHTRQSTEFDCRSLSAEGRLRWLHIIVSPELDEASGQIASMYGSVTNITEQKLAEEALKKSEEKWRTIIKTSPDGIAIVSPQGSIRFVSDNLLKLHGFENEQEMIDRHFLEFFDPAEHETAQFRLEELFKGNRLGAREFKVSRKDGSAFYVELAAELLRDQQGRPESIFAIERDITERKLAQQALEASELKFRTLFETMSQGVIYQDQTGRVIHANPAALQLLGLDLEELTRQAPLQPNWHAIHEDGSPFPPEDFPGDVALQSGRITSAVAGVYQPISQEYNWLSMTAIPEFHEGETAPFRVFTTLSDITDLKKALAELAHFNRDLEELAEQRTREIRQLSNLNDAILQNAGVAIVATRLDGTITTFNRAAELMLGYSADEVIGKMTPDHFHDQDELASTSREMAALGADHPTNLDVITQTSGVDTGGSKEWRMQRKDGTVFPCMLSLSSFLDADGQPGGLIGVARDTTEEKQMIAKLQESEERFYRLFSDHAAVMLIIDPANGLIEEANKAAISYYGYDFAHVKDIRISDINALSADQVHAEMESATRQHRNYFIFPHKLASGIVRTVEVHSSPIHIRGRQLLFSIIHDITDRVQAEAALRKSEAENRAILEVVPDLFFRLSRTGVFLNAHAGDPVNLFVPPDLFLGKHVREVLPAQIAQQAMESIEKAFLDKTTSTFEYGLMIHSEPRRYENRMVAISDDEVLSIVRDITERHQAEAAIHRSESLLKMMTMSTPLAFYVVDHQTDVISYFNHPFCEIWRIEHLEEKMLNEEIVHNDVMQACLVLLQDQHGFIDIINKFNYTDNRLVVEDELRLADGRILRLYSSQIRGQQDEYYGRLFIFEDITKRRTEESFVQMQRDLATRLSATSDLEQALQWSLESLSRIAYVDVTGIYLLNTETGNFDLAAQLNASPEFLAEGRYIVPDSPLSRNLRSGEAVFIQYPQAARSGIAFSNPDDLVSLAAAPILHEGRVIGSIHLGSKAATNFFSEHIVLLETLAAEIGAAVARIFAERALLNSQQNFRMLFETIDDFIFILDLHGRIILTNPAVQTRLGIGEDEIRGSHILDLHPNGRRQEAAQCLQGMLMGRTAYCPVPLLADNGSLIPVETRIIRGTWDGKEVMYGISRDISERQKTEQALREAEYRWHFALEGSGDGVWDWDLQINSLFYSRQWKSMLGYAEHEISNQYNEWSSRIHPADREHCSMDIGRHLRGESELYANEHRLQHKDGHYIWVLDRGKVVESADDGKPLRMIGTQTDITKLKVMEQTLREAVDREKELNDLKSKFISVASHEFRTPLATIMVATESLLAYHTKMTIPQQTERLIKIKSQVTDLNKIIEDLLQLSRLQTVDASLEPSEFDLKALIHEIVEELAPQAESVHIECRCDHSAFTVFLDKKQIRMALTNLLSNALKYSPPGQRVRLDIKQLESMVVLAIADQGIGIPEKEIRHLFSPFFRASNVGEIIGTGLGLNIVKECIVKHGGTIDVQSVENEGTTFTVQLPLRVDVHQSQESL